VNTKYHKLLQILINENQKITGGELAKILQVSPRSIRSYLKEIDEILIKSNKGARVRSIKGQGYVLDIHDSKKFKEFMQSISNPQEEIPSEPFERVMYILFRFLTCNEFIKLENLADEMFSSKSTLLNDLKEVKNILNKYSLTLGSKPNYGMKIEGNEKSIRFALADLLFKDKATETNQMRLFFPASRQQCKIISDIVLAHIQEAGLNISDNSLENLVHHILISCTRVRFKQCITLPDSELRELKTKNEFIMASEVSRELEEKFQVHFNDQEVAYIEILIMGARLFDYKKQEMTLDVVDEIIARAVDEAMSEVSKLLMLSLEDDELRKALNMHLTNTLTRYKYSMNMFNPMLDAIKKTYPLAFDAGVAAGHVVEKICGIKVNEHESGYLALHFAAAIERSKSKIKPKRCLIVCTTGLGSSRLLYYKLKSVFGDKLILVGPTELNNLDVYKANDVDFIISTVPLPDILEIPHIVVNTLLGDKEIDEISKLFLLESYKYKYIEKYLDVSHIYLRLPLSTAFDVIEYLGDKLHTEHGMDEGVTESIINREKAAYTSYGNFVAIPHPLEPKSDKTFWTIATLEKPIQWGNHLVQFVCLLHVGRDSIHELEPMYNILMRLIENKIIIRQLIESTKKEEVMDRIREFAKENY